MKSLVIFVFLMGKTIIIEYSDLPAALAEKRNTDGSLVLVAGSPAIHIISRSFVQRLTEHDSISLPWHRADKKVSYIDVNGVKIVPEKENAVKLESFIFDALPIAKKTMILEAEREKQFAPTKNKTGVDSVESCKAMLIARDAEWLELYAGVKVPRKSNGAPDCVLELSPKSFLDSEDVKIFRDRIKYKEVKNGEEKYYE